MKNTKQNVVKLLAILCDDRFQTAEFYKKAGNTAMYKDYAGQAVALNEAITLITDKSFFDTISNIYKLEA